MNTPKESDEVVKLVEAWLSGDADGTFSDAVIDAPESAWAAILEILKGDLSDDQRALLAAGPLENLLVFHGAEFISRVEHEAETNARLNHLLGGVWRQDMEELIWERVQRVRKAVW